MPQISDPKSTGEAVTAGLKQQTQWIRLRTKFQM